MKTRPIKNKTRFRSYILILYICLIPIFCSCLPGNLLATIAITNNVLCSGGSAQSSSTTYIFNDVIQPTIVIGSKTSTSYSIIDGIYGYIAAAASNFLTWYFAEGCTLEYFDTWILMQNIDTGDAVVTATFYTGGLITSESTSVTQTIPANKRTTIYVNNIVENEANIGTKLESNKNIVASSSIYRDSGNYHWLAGGNTIGARQPATTWYFAEGCTKDYDTWILIFNPNSSSATVTVSFYNEDGLITTTSETVPTNNRWSILVNNISAANNQVNVAAIVQSNVGIVAERSMYWDSDNIANAGAHRSIGTSSTSTIWYFAEGSTQTSNEINFDEYLLIFNPDATTAATITITLYGNNGVIDHDIGTLIIEPLQRETIYVNNWVTNREVGAKIEATNGVGIVAERSMYWDSVGFEHIDGHNTIGAGATATTWYFPEGSTLIFDTYILLLNPNTSPATVNMSLEPSSGDTVTLDPITIPALSRYSIKVDDYIASAAVSSKVVSDIAIVVEGSMYWNLARVPWAGGICSRGESE